MVVRIFFLGIILSYSTAVACINEYRTKLNGTVVETDPISGRVSPKEIDPAKLKEEGEMLLVHYKKTNIIRYLSDYAATLIYLGELEKAKQIYHKIEKDSSGLYTTASNLGTIYELLGRPDSALFWIKKAMVLNPESHRGSEWIHIKILEFKLLPKKNFSESILNLNFGKEELPSNPDSLELQKLRWQLWIQLQERTSLVQTPDTIVGNLYFDLGNILAQTSDLETAMESYGAAMEYGYNSELMQKRIAAFKELTNSAQGEREIMEFIKRHILLFSLLSLGLLVGFISFIFYIFNRKSKKRKQQAG